MSGRPKHTRKDQNQSAIVEELRQLGFLAFDVADNASLGFDLVVIGLHRRWMLPMALLVEVKSEGGKLTEREEEVAAEMQYRFGDEAPLIVAQTTERVLEWFHART